MSRQIIVLGVPRTGTSMVAGILHYLNIHMGDRLIGADSSNPWGHFEDAGASELNRRILGSAGGSWHRPVDTSHVDAADRIAAFVAKRDGAHEVWGMKDPRLCVTLRHWLPFLSNPVFLRTSRNPADIDASVMRRNGLPEQEARRLRLIYEAALDSLRGLDAFVVPYELALAEPEAMVRCIAAYVGVPVTQAAIASIHPKKVRA